MRSGQRTLGRRRALRYLRYGAILWVAAMGLYTSCAWAGDAGGDRAATLSPEKKQAVIAAYRAMKPGELDQKTIAALPTGMKFATIDVSDKVRSASFGHTTTLMVPVGAAGDANQAREFYVAYGRSTNTKERQFGPFALVTSAR